MPSVAAQSTPHSLLPREGVVDDGRPAEAPNSARGRVSFFDERDDGDEQRG